MTKYKKIISFTFNNFSFLAPKVVDILKRVQQIIRNNVVYPRLIDLVFRIINCAIPKNLCGTICCPSS
jgi:hypothetical protein